MDITIIQKIDGKYFEEFYAEWLKFRSKFKKWEQRIGLFSILLAILIYFFDPTFKSISGGMLVIGTLMVYEYYASKTKWMKDRLASKMNHESIIMIFKEDQIQSIGPFTNTKGKWDFFKEAIETEKGVFLIPENGISIYLQKTSFERVSDVRKIIKKIKALQNH